MEESELKTARDKTAPPPPDSGGQCCKLGLGVCNFFYGRVGRRNSERSLFYCKSKFLVSFTRVKSERRAIRPPKALFPQILPMKILNRHFVPNNLKIK